MEKIAQDMFEKLYPTEEIGIYKRQLDIEDLLCKQPWGVRTLGILGEPSLGKTTLAREVHRGMSGGYDNSWFIKDFHKEYNVEPPSERQKRILLVLDDVLNVGDVKSFLGVVDRFGPGSLIIITSRYRQVLEQCHVNEIYELKGLNDEDALKLFTRYAFRNRVIEQKFLDLTMKVVKRSYRNPSTHNSYAEKLKGKKKTEMMSTLLEICHGNDYEHGVLIILRFKRINLENLETVVEVEELSEAPCIKEIDLRDCQNLESISVTDKLKRLKVLSISDCNWNKRYPRVVWTLIEFNLEGTGIREITDTTPHSELGTESVLGISLDISSVDELFISERGFSGMRILRFLKFYINLENKEVKKEVNVHLPDGLDYLCPKLRLLHWEAFPLTSMPSSFRPVNLVELTMEASKLEKLWDGVQPLGSLMCMSLRGSLNLKEIPDLSCATSLEKLDLGGCSSLTMLPSSIGNLHKLKDLDMEDCIYLEVLPTGVNLESLYCLILNGCSRLRSFPKISVNISDLYLDGTAIEEVPGWIENISRLSYLSMNGCNKLKKVSPNISKLKNLEEVDFSDCGALTHDSWQNHDEEISTSLMRVDMSGNNFGRLPDTWTSIQPKDLIINNCRRLVSLPELPASLSMLSATNCKSLERVCDYFHYRQTALQFINCFKLSQEARDLILQSDCVYAILPGAKISAHFTYRAVGNFLTISIPHSSVSKNFPSFKACIVVDSRSGWFHLGVRWSFRGGNDSKYISCLTNTTSMCEHIITFRCEFSADEVSDVQFQFICLDHRKEKIKIIEFGIQLLEVSLSLDCSDQNSETEYDDDFGGSNAEAMKSSKWMRIT